MPVPVLPEGGGVPVAPTVAVTQEQGAEAQENVLASSPFEAARMGLEELEQALVENPLAEGQGYFPEAVRKAMLTDLKFLQPKWIEKNLKINMYEQSQVYREGPSDRKRDTQSHWLATLQREALYTAENPAKDETPVRQAWYIKGFVKEILNTVRVNLKVLDRLDKQRASLDQPDDALAQDAQIEPPDAPAAVAEPVQPKIEVEKLRREPEAEAWMQWTSREYHALQASTLITKKNGRS